RIAVAGQRADDEVPLRDGALEGLEFLLVRQEFGRVAVIVAGVRARADLDRLDTLRDQVVEDFFERLLSEQDGEYADPHADSNLQTVTQRRARAAFSIAASTR